MRYNVNKGHPKYDNYYTAMNTQPDQMSMVPSITNSSGSGGGHMIPHYSGVSSAVSAYSSSASQSHDGPRCRDGSLDMRCAVNKGYSKYG